MEKRQFTTILDTLEQYQGSEKIALICGEDELSYRELIADARHIARGLMAEGVRKGERVLFSMHRTVDAIRALLGILYAGASYVAADPEWPRERLDFAARDARTVFSMTDESCHRLREREPSSGELPEVRGEDEAAIYYTSGSTGQPKGAVLCHIALVSPFLDAAFDELAWETYLVNSKLTFVVAGINFFTAFSRGKTILFSTESEHSSLDLLAAFMERHHADGIHSMPSVFLRFLENPSFARAFSKLKFVVVSGEMILPSVAEKISRATKGALLIDYGTTETFHCTIYPYRNDEKIHMGNAAYGTRLHILNEALEEISLGGEGELFIGGIPAKYGHYLNRPELDAEKYVEHPRFGRLFRTGDLARREKDGEITLLGRKDGMVKLHGQRIEIGEVENAMMGFPGIRQAAVSLVGESPHEMLAGCYTAAGEVSETELRRHLSDRLPYYMVPARLVFLREMPLNSNGKTDRPALAKMIPPKVSYRAPVTSEEKLLCTLYGEVLGLREPVGVTDSFFELGGDSIAAMALLSLLRERHALRLRMVDIFIHPRPQELARAAKKHGEESPEASEESLPPLPQELQEWKAAGGIEEIYPAEAASKLYFLLQESGSAYTRGLLLNLRLRLRRSFSREAFTRRIQNILRRHPALRSFFRRDREGQLWQVFRREGEVPVYYRSLKDFTEDARERFLPGFFRVMDEAAAPFQAGCFPLGEGRSEILLRLMHTHVDGMSVRLIVNELAADSEPMGEDSFYPYRRQRWRMRRSFPEELKAYYAAMKERMRIPVTPKAAGSIIRREIGLDISGTQRLKEACGQMGISLGSYVEYCFGKGLLAAMDRREIWFSHIFPGRDESFDGAEGIVGNLFYAMPVCIREDMTAPAFQQELMKPWQYPYVTDCPEYARLNRHGLEEGIVSRLFAPLCVNVEYLREEQEKMTTGHYMELAEGKLRIVLRYPEADAAKKGYQKIEAVMRELLNN